MSLVRTRVPAFFVGALLAASVALGTEPASDNPYEIATEPVAAGRIDEFVFAQCRARGITLARPCSEVVFVRRVFLDVIGTLPTPTETRQFLADARPDKRARLIDALLERPEFADYWAMKWSDVLRIKSEFPINLWPNAAQAYHRWVYVAVRDNLPYDRFAHELLTANGSNFRVGPVNFLRAVQGREPEALARAVGLAFLGRRPERWTPEELAGVAACFQALRYKSTGEWKEEIVFFDPAQVPGDGCATARLPDGAVITLSPTLDPRIAFADWLVAPKNPWFARAGANRIWAWLLGRGIVHEPDDFRPENPPANPALLDHLATEFARSGYDVRRLMRLILNSQTYQLSALSRAASPEVAEANFACYPVRRLEAEVLIDALNQLTGTTEKYSSPIPEPFTFMPDAQRAIALPDGSVSSTFLEMFGRPARDTGLAAERNDRITATQRLQLLNSTQVQRKLEQGPALQALIRPRAPRETIDALFLAILSRPPTPDERQAALAHALTPGIDARAAAQDLAWALINGAEFLHRH